MISWYFLGVPKATSWKLNVARIRIKLEVKLRAICCLYGSIINYIVFLGITAKNSSFGSLNLFSIAAMFMFSDLLNRHFRGLIVYKVAISSREYQMSPIPCSDVSVYF